MLKNWLHHDYSQRNRINKSETSWLVAGRCFSFSLLGVCTGIRLPCNYFYWHGFTSRHSWGRLAFIGVWVVEWHQVHHVCSEEMFKYAPLPAPCTTHLERRDPKGGAGGAPLILPGLSRKHRLKSTKSSGSKLKDQEIWDHSQNQTLTFTNGLAHSILKPKLQKCQFCWWIMNHHCLSLSTSLPLSTQYNIPSVNTQAEILKGHICCIFHRAYIHMLADCIWIMCYNTGTLSLYIMPLSTAAMLNVNRRMVT